MDFSLNRMPSTQKEIEWQWERGVKENIDFSEIRVNGASCDFEANLDYFNLTDTKADQISFIGRRYEFFVLSRYVLLIRIGAQRWMLQ